MTMLNKKNKIKTTTIKMLKIFPADSGLAFLIENCHALREIKQKKKENSSSKKKKKNIYEKD